MIKLGDGQEKDTESTRVFSLKYEAAVAERVLLATAQAESKWDILPASALQPVVPECAGGAGSVPAPSGGGAGLGADAGAGTAGAGGGGAAVEEVEELVEPQKRRDETDKKKKKKKK